MFRLCSYDLTIGFCLGWRSIPRILLTSRLVLEFLGLNSQSRQILSHSCPGTVSSLSRINSASPSLKIKKNSNLEHSNMGPSQMCQSFWLAEKGFLNSLCLCLTKMRRFVVILKNWIVFVFNKKVSLHIIEMHMPLYPIHIL